ncbi:16911_t:CDS:2, partial [Gigaspora rosea]
RFKRKIHRSAETIKAKGFTLRVAEREGWSMARKILKPIPNEGDEFKDLLVEARKQSKLLYTISAPPPLYAVHTTYSTHSSDSARATASKSKGVSKPGPDLSEHVQIRWQREVHKEVDFFETKLMMKAGDYAREKKNEWESTKKEKANALAKKAVSPFYKAKAEKYWALYEKVCKKFELDVENLQEDGILVFIMWLDIMGLMSQILWVLQSNKERSSEK